MAGDSALVMTPGFSRKRVAELLQALELMAAGNTERRAPISDQRDELDAIAYGINVLVGELGWTTGRVIEAQQARAVELQEAVERAEHAIALKNVFVRNVSHEIRTPIAAMLGFADLLLSDDLSREDRADLVSRLQANGQALLSLVGNLLDLSRLDAGKIELQLEVTPVFELVREVVASVDVEARKKGLDVRFELSGNALGSIYIDRHRLRQILVNVIANAIKFTDSGGIVIALGAKVTPSGDEWAIDVTDTGIGIAPDRHVFLFEPFEQADASIARKYGGTGIGLALSRRLAEQLGGALTLVRSEPGRGSTFRITVRSQGAAKADTAPPPTPAQQADNAIRGMRILLAEDHAHMQVAVSRLLEHAGTSVEVAKDGREAVTKALAGNFDVVLMDLRMPQVDGLEAARYLRQQGCSVPIVAMTADIAALRQAEAMEAGCDACISKPFTMADLVASIRVSRQQGSGKAGSG